MLHATRYFILCYMQTISILGRQPAISLAELESLYGADIIRPIGDYAALLDCEPTDISPTRLGGVIKHAKLLAEIKSTNWRDIEKHLSDTVPEHIQYVPEGKFKLGISVYGLDVTPDIINRTNLKLKKLIKATGRSVRVVPNKALELNAAQVLHNQLTRSTGWELLLIRDGSQTLLAQTLYVQDINAYAARDQVRPKRDAFVGMLPPKLAQIIVNLAVGNKHSSELTILDPFCGTGVLLQEAILMGYSVIGSDISPKMVEFSNENLEWLKKSHGLSAMSYQLSVADAISATLPDNFDTVATETYLGQPMVTLPDREKFERIVREVDQLHTSFLKNLHGQLKSGTRICLAVPAWRQPNGEFRHLPTLDHLEKLGYTRTSFVHASNDELLYNREDQLVARELVVLTRN